MTPTADLMKLVEKWREEVSGEGDALDSVYEIGERDGIRWCADELQAALTASCDARVGGEVVRYEWRRSREPSGWTDWVAGSEESHDEILAGHWDNPDTGRVYEARALVVATPAQPKASCTCPSGDGSLRWPCPRHPPEQPKASEETEQSIKADAYDMVAEALRNAGLLESGGSVVDAVTVLARAKASEDAKCQRCREWATMGVGDGSGNLFVHGTYDAIKACQRQLLHPKASEGKAGGEDAARLKHIAAIAHDGGLAGINPHDALSMIRRLSLPAWSATGGVNERQAGLAAAMTATLTAPGADDGL